MSSNVKATQSKKCENCRLVTVRLTWDPARLPIFCQVFQQGVLVEAQVDASIREVLGQCRVSDEYLDKRINTIFLDGKPVDNVDAAVVKNASTLALSAAMPGFVGAALRKGGVYAGMRSTITYEQEACSTGPHKGSFVLKLYNMVERELGPHFLQAGVMLGGDTFNEFLEHRSEAFWLGYVKGEIDGQDVDVSYVRAREWSRDNPLVRLVVTAAA